MSFHRNRFSASLNIVGRYKKTGLFFGTSGSGQLSFENYEYEDKVKEFEGKDEYNRKEFDKNELSYDLSKSKLENYLLNINHPVGGPVLLLLLMMKFLKINAPFRMKRIKQLVLFEFQENSIFQHIVRHPLFDNYSLTLKAKLLLLPGSSLVTMKNSTLVFNPGEEVDYKDVSIKVKLDFPPIVNVNVEVYIKGEKTRNRGSLMAYDRSFYSYDYDSFNHHGYGLNAESAYWKFTKSSNHMIMGNVTIENMPDKSYKYLISVPISISKQAINKLVISSYVQTYDVKGSQAGSWWFSGSHSTYVSSVNMITSFNALPLISNGKAYIKDNNLNIKGVFDDDTHLLTAGDQTYFLWTPNDYLIGGSDPENQNALTDYTVIPTLVNSVIANQIIKTNDKYYIFYKGVFVPVLDSIASGTTYTSVNASLRKFCSNNNSPLVAASPDYDSVAMNYDSTNKRWAFTNFNKVS